MSTRHSTTMEVGGWMLLAAVIAWVLYILFHKQFSTDVTVVSSKVGGVSTGPPVVRPNNPDVPTIYLDDSGTTWEWNPAGQQWHISNLQVVPGNPA